MIRVRISTGVRDLKKKNPYQLRGLISPSYSNIGVLSQAQSGQEVKFTTNLHVVPRLTITIKRATPLLHQYDFMVWNVETLPFYYSQYFSHEEKHKINAPVRRGLFYYSHYFSHEENIK